MAKKVPVGSWATQGVSLIVWSVNPSLVSNEQNSSGWMSGFGRQLAQDDAELVQRPEAVAVHVHLRDEPGAAVVRLPRHEYLARGAVASRAEESVLDLDDLVAVAARNAETRHVRQTEKA